MFGITEKESDTLMDTFLPESVYFILAKGKTKFNISRFL